MKKDDGFTLIELVVVMLIVGVLSIGSMLGMSVLGLGSGKSTVSRINTLLDYVQIENMTKNEPYYLVITEQNGSYFLSVQTKTGGSRITKSREELDLKRGEITFRNKDGQLYWISNTDIIGREDRDLLEVCFSKETGGIIENYLNEIVSQINVLGPGNSYSIRLVEATGKHYIE